MGRCGGAGRERAWRSGSESGQCLAVGEWPQEQLLRELPAAAAGADDAVVALSRLERTNNRGAGSINAGAGWRRSDPCRAGPALNLSPVRVADGQ